MQKTTTCLMFVGEQHGKAEEAMGFYVSLFKNSRIVDLVRHGPEQAEVQGTVAHAVFEFDGQEFAAMDGGLAHNFTFTPAMSILITCEAEPEIDALFEKLSAGGSVLMPLDIYPISAKFAWVNDRYGVSWQMNLPDR